MAAYERRVREAGVRRLPTRLEPTTRSMLTALLAGSSIAAVCYRLLITGRLEQTCALFVGLPMLLGLLTIHLTRTSSTWGGVVRGNLVFLAIVAPLLGEGSICLLMAAPLFLLVSFGVVLVAQRIVRKRPPGRRALGLCVLPLLWGVGEQRVASLAPKPEVVRTVTVVGSDVGTWLELVRRAAPPVASTSRFLNLGFPRPERYEVTDDSARIDFTPAEGRRGHWLLARAVTDDGVAFSLVEDTTMIAHWLELVSHRIHVKARADGRVELVQETTFLPRLSPRWYFVPAERWAIEAAHALAIATWRAAAIDGRGGGKW